MFQDGVARDRPVRIETCGLLFLFLREKEDVEAAGDEHDRDADTDVRAEGRSFLAGDSAPVHQIAINVIESEIGYVRPLIFFNRGRTDLRSSLNSLRWRLEVEVKSKLRKSSQAGSLFYNEALRHLNSSPRFSRWPRKPGFGQINITLDSAQGLVVDGFFIAQFDHGVAFCL